MRILSESIVQIEIVGKASICLKYGESSGERNLSSFGSTVMNVPTKTAMGHHH